MLDTISDGERVAGGGEGCRMGVGEGVICVLSLLSSQRVGGNTELVSSVAAGGSVRVCLRPWKCAGGHKQGCEDVGHQPSAAWFPCAWFCSHVSLLVCSRIDRFMALVSIQRLRVRVVLLHRTPLPKLSPTVGSRTRQSPPLQTSVEPRGPPQMGAGHGRWDWSRPS